MHSAHFVADFERLN